MPSNSSRGIVELNPVLRSSACQGGTQQHSVGHHGPIQCIMTTINFVNGKQTKVLVGPWGAHAALAVIRSGDLTHFLLEYSPACSKSSQCRECTLTVGPTDCRSSYIPPFLGAHKYCTAVRGPSWQVDSSRPSLRLWVTCPLLQERVKFNAVPTVHPKPKCTKPYSKRTFFKVHVAEIILSTRCHRPNRSSFMKIIDGCHAVRQRCWSWLLLIIHDISSLNGTSPSMPCQKSKSPTQSTRDSLDRAALFRKPTCNNGLLLCTCACRENYTFPSQGG